MCLNRVYVKDYLFRHRFGGFYNCGHCKACRQQSANRRASRIKAHHPDGYTCYFVNLDYSNRFVPFIKKSDFLNEDLNRIPVYRNYDYYRKSRTNKLTYSKKPIDYYPVDNYVSYDQIKDLPTLVTDRKGDLISFDTDRIGVCLSSDKQKFIKRFRSKVARIYNKNIPISFYGTFEYGPTTCRPHLHFAMWLPNRYFTPLFARKLVYSSWSYSDRAFKYSQHICEIARSCARYLASYVNCDSSIPQFLRDVFPPKNSHSLGIGFDEDNFKPDRFYSSFSTGNFKYLSIYTDKKGKIHENYFSFPKYVLYRYLPKIKGFNRLNRDKLFCAYTNLEKFKVDYSSSLTRLVRTYRNGKVYETILYPSTIIDCRNIPIYFRKNEFESFIRRFNKTFYLYYEPLGISKYDFIHACIEYNIRLSCSFYSDQFLGYQGNRSLYCYDNLEDVAQSIIDAPTVLPLLSCLSSLDSDTFPNIIDLNTKLVDQYDRNIKQRKINLS